MDFIGQKICEVRKVKGLTQEELAELSQVNLRTIQRIEKNENEPRGKTLNLICEVLQIDIEELIENKGNSQKINLATIVVNGFFLISLNLIFTFILGYLTAAAGTNINSRVGALLLSFFMPMFIVYLTIKMSGIERMLKFGMLFIAYLSFILIMDPFRGLDTFLLPCLVFALATLFFGHTILKKASC